MWKKIVLVLAMLALGLGAQVRAATIVWVSEWMSPAGGSPYDQGWIDLLRAQGYTVQADTTFNYMALDATRLATLEEADLIIMSRTSNSGNYATDTAEVTQWNSIGTPLILLNAYLVRTSRWLWINSNTQTEYAAETMLEVVKADHPVFNGISAVGNQVDVIDAAVNSGQGTFVTATDVGNGTLIARRADNGNIWIAEWGPGTPFYSGTTQQPSDKRMLFTGGGGGGQAAGSMNLTPTGQKMFLNAVAYMLGGAANLGAASVPLPGVEEIDVPRDAVLSWTPGAYAAAHDVYLGTVFADVNTADRANQKGVLVSQGQTGTTFDPAGLLGFGQTYYWRVDEVNAPPTSTVYRGTVWSFTTEPYAYVIRPIAATASSSFNADTVPERTMDESGLNDQDQHSTESKDMWLSSATEPGPVWIQYEFDKVYKLYQMWVWNSNQGIEPALGFGAKDVTIEVSQDGSTWATVAGVGPFAQAPGLATYTPNTTVDLGGALARYVKLTIQSNWSILSLPQRGLSEVRFFQIPVYARDPQPGSGATGVVLDATLGWRPGREATRHGVYFGTDPNALVLSKTVTEHEVGLSALSPEYGRTYFWRVAEVNDAAVIQSWMGEAWSFSTVAYGVVDDFELYDDECNRVYYAWKSGASNGANPDCGLGEYSGNGTGSIVGNNDTPYAERTAALVHSGNQSMPFWYDNTKSPFYSEASREWSTPQSWNRGGVNTLAVYYQFSGQTQGFVEVSPGVIVMNGMGTDIFGTVDEGRFVYKQLSGDGAIVARVENLANTESWAKAGVMIRETLDAGSPFAIAVYGGANGVRLQMRLTAGGGATSDSSTATAGQLGARAPVWVKLERTGNEFRGYYSADGQAWAAMIGNPQTIVMAKDVYIGLAVTSHVTGVVCGARFSGVSTTGTVTGGWQPGDLGVAQATGGDVLEPVYLVVEDSGGKSKVVTGLDPKVTITGAWEEWTIPLSDLTAGGVNLNGVKKVTIGVGDKVSPKAGGTGKLYIDDLRLIRTGGN